MNRRILPHTRRSAGAAEVYIDSQSICIWLKPAGWEPDDLLSIHIGGRRLELDRIYVPIVKPKVERKNRSGSRGKHQLRRKLRITKREHNCVAIRQIAHRHWKSHSAKIGENAEP